MALWTLDGWNETALRTVPSHWHRMSARERREAIGQGDRSDQPPDLEVGVDGGYIVPDRFVEHLPIPKFRTMPR